MTDLSVAFELARRRTTTKTEEDKATNRALFGSDDEDDEDDENTDDVFHDTVEQEGADQDADLGQDVGGQADPAPAEAAPEEEGYVNAEGLNYQQPRAPFAGTIWNGLVNGFPRIDQENHRRPTGNRPNGCVVRTSSGCASTR